MERYFHNEPDDDENEYEYENSEQFVKASNADVIEVMQMELAEQELNEKLLDQAYRVASSEWRWMFRSAAYKMKKLRSIFNKMKQIISE